MSVNGQKHAGIDPIARLDPRQVAVGGCVTGLAAANQVGSDVLALIGRERRNVAAVGWTAWLGTIELHGAAVEFQPWNVGANRRLSHALTPGEAHQIDFVSFEPGWRCVG